MELKLTKILSSLTVFAAWAYSLGWIKSSYYFRSFGIGLESVDFSVQDYLFASWYAVENVIFFILLLWIASIAKKTWVWFIAAPYLVIPFLTDWSYSHLTSPTWYWLFGWLVRVPHSLLKYYPFVVLILVFLFHWNVHTRFFEVSWPRERFFFVLLSIVAVAWSISAAKHFGNADANGVLLNPGKSLLRVKVLVPENASGVKPSEPRQAIYLLYFSTHRCILLDTTDFKFGQSGTHFTILLVPAEKIEMIEGIRNFQPDSGHMFW